MRAPQKHIIRESNQEYKIPPSAPTLLAGEFLDRESEKRLGLLRDAEQALQATGSLFLQFKNLSDSQKLELEKSCLQFKRYSLLKALIKAKITDGQGALFELAKPKTKHRYFITKDEMKLIEELIALGVNSRPALANFFHCYQKHQSAERYIAAAAAIINASNKENNTLEMLKDALEQSHLELGKFLVKAGCSMKAFEEKYQVNPLTVYAMLGLGNYFRKQLYDVYLSTGKTVNLSCNGYPSRELKCVEMTCNDSYLWKLRTIAAYRNKNDSHSYIVKCLDQVFPKNSTNAFYNAYALAMHSITSSVIENISNDCLSYPPHRKRHQFECDSYSPTVTYR